MQVYITLLIKTAYSGMIRYNANGEFNVPFGDIKILIQI